MTTRINTAFIKTSQAWTKDVELQSQSFYENPNLKY